MQACLPGKLESEFHAVDSAPWNGQRIVAYVSGNALIILRGLHHFHQTITHVENERLRGVAIDPASGKIATTSGSIVYIHRPLQDFGDLRWTLQYSYAPTNITSIACLSWGLPGEILIGGSRLALLNTDSSLSVCWESALLANPCKLASFSHDASLVASAGWHDRLTKVWRRGFIGGQNERFDPVYLSHPATVTSLRWRGRPPADEHADAVLYTTCVDGYLRVWTVPEPHCLHILDLWTEIDLNLCIQPRSPLSPTPWKKRYTFIVDKWDFKKIVDIVTQQEGGSERLQHTREHLRELACNEPEVCFILDDVGNMSAWALERIGCKARLGPSVMHIGHAEDFGIRLQSDSVLNEGFAVLRAFPSPSADGSLTILGHLFDGRMQWLSSQVEQLFDPSPQAQGVQVDAEFTGHSQTIQRLMRTNLATYFISQAEAGEIIVWRRLQGGDSHIVRQSVLSVEPDLQDFQMLQYGRFAVMLHRSLISIWNVQTLKASRVAAVSFDFDPGSRIVQPSTESSDHKRLLVVDPNLKTTTIRLLMQRESVNIELDVEAKVDGPMTLANGPTNGASQSLQSEKSVMHIQTIDFEYIAASDSHKNLTYYKIQMDAAMASTRWSKAAQIQLDLERSSYVKCSPTHAATINANRTGFTIWNVLANEIEYTHQLPTHETVESMQWCTSSQLDLALAVILPHRILVFLQVSYDATLQEPPWMLVKEISILQLTSLPISDVVWTADQALILSAGNQLFVLNSHCQSPRSISLLAVLCDPSQSETSLRRLSLAASQTLPVFHPYYVFQQLLCGRFPEAQNVLATLRNKLTYWTEGDVLPSNLEGTSDSPAHTNGYSSDASNINQPQSQEQAPSFSEEDSSALDDHLQAVQLPWISDTDQKRLRALCNCVRELSLHSSSIDTPGLMYVNSLCLDLDHTFPYAANPWRSTVCALLSNSQDNLLGITLSRQVEHSFPWVIARRHQTSLWLTSREALCAHFEAIARAEYTKSEDRDPLDCSLYYLALRKKSVLQGLWRMVHGHREREQTMRVLSQDFGESRWRSAALKNAYALLGRRRTKYAAAWFLLAEDVKSAVNVLVGDEVADLELAISVARVFDGDQGHALRDLVESALLPQAVAEGNRWKAIYGLLILQREDLALQACLRPLQEVIKGTEKVKISTAGRMWWNNDPSLLAVYQVMREQWLRNPSRRSRTFPSSVKEESNAIKSAARTYMRMGCGWIGLDVLRNWTFTSSIKPASTLSVENDERNLLAMEKLQIVQGGPEKAVTSTLDDYESQDPSSSQVSSTSRRYVTEEPSASSIFDSFF